MFKILILEPDEHLLNLLQNNFSSELGAEVIPCSNYLEAKNVLEKEKNIDCLLLRSYLGKENLALNVLNYMIHKKYSFKTLIWGDIEHSEEFARCLPEKMKLKDLLNEIIKELDLPVQEINKIEVPDYTPFKLHYFFQINKFESDIYLKIAKKDGDQYVKRILAGDEFDKKLLLKYKQSGLNELYVEKQFRHKFWDTLVDNSILRLKELYQQRKNFVNIDNIIEFSNDSYNLSQDLLNSLGLSEQTVKLANISIKSMAETVKSMSTLGPMLKKLLSNKSSYAYKKCHLISLFSYEVIKRIGWFPIDKRNNHFNTMVFVSFMHDIVLHDEKLLRIHSKIDLYRSEISDEGKKLVTNHANIISSIVKKYPKAPLGVDIIIKQHHGTTNGIGFSEGNNSNLSKLAIVLIVLEKFVIRLIDFDSNKDSIKQIIEEFYEDFSQPSYKKVLDTLIETIFRDLKKKKAK